VDDSVGGSRGRIRERTDVRADTASETTDGHLIMRVVTFIVASATAAAVVGCGGSTKAPVSAAPFVRYHAPSQGWTANVPAGWRSVALGPAFVRGDPLADPTRLVLEAYPNHTPDAALHEFSALQGITVTAQEAVRTGEQLHWQRYRGLTSGKTALAVELAVAKDGANADVAALVARRAQLGGLVQSALLPALDSFDPGAPEQPHSVLAAAPPDPSYWPTAGWRAATPSSQGMDAKRLDAMVAEIRSAKLPIDSVTVVRHGYVVLDRAFGKFASGSLGEPYASGRLHELQSGTKSVTSTLLGIALHENPTSGVIVQTPVVNLAAAVHYVPANLDARKRAMTLEDMLTMQSGIAWKESGYAYTAGSGNDVMAMLGTNDWTRYVIDRPMAAQPGTTFVYDTGTAQLLSAAITFLTQHPAADLAAKELFAPLGITDYKWPASPEGSSSGGFGLLLQPRDLAKLAYLYLHRGRWDGRQVVPAAWVEQSTTDHVASPPYEYGYLWWLDGSDGYAYMAGLYGQLAVVDPGDDLVAVITAHIPATADSGAVTRWLLEQYVLPAAR
jgi:CubicO group peptidase (beta-lactamase class C family)